MTNVRHCATFLIMAGTQGIRLEEVTQKRLKRLAEKKDRSVNYLIKDAVERYLNDQESYELEKQEDQERLQYFLDTGEHVTHEEIKSKLEGMLEKANRLSK